MEWQGVENSVNGFRVCLVVPALHQSRYSLWPTFAEGREELFKRDEIFGKRKMHVDFGSSENTREPAHAQRKDTIKK